MYEIIDLTFLNSFTGGNKEKNSKYINMFLQNAPSLLDAIEENLKKEDWASLKTSAHSLKPQISYMGIKSAEELIKNIERDAADKINLSTISEKVGTLRNILEKAFPELQQASQ
jgi:HPt (histidine-containing phosphotransfer) domain-containing protein